MNPSDLHQPHLWASHGSAPPPPPSHTPLPSPHLPVPRPTALTALAEVASITPFSHNTHAPPTPPPAAIPTPQAARPAMPLPQAHDPLGHVQPNGSLTLPDAVPLSSFLGFVPLPPLASSVAPSPLAPMSDLAPPPPPTPDQAPPLRASDQESPPPASDQAPPPDVPSANPDHAIQAPSSDDEDDSEQGEEQIHRRHRWRPMVECSDEPSQDELDHIESKGEHSAEDVEYWERQTYFDVDDPEIQLGECGRISFTVKYNGTKENPNKERVMLSDIAHIGGYDWRIKFYPRGDNSSYLSCYVECVSMRAPGFEERQEFPTLPFPQLQGDQCELKKRRSVAAQIGVLMFNPSEPRVNEFQADAHQFHKQKAVDYGWQKFSYEYHDSFHQRRFGQRTAILRDDTLAFTAFIRIVHDPTGCMWEHNGKGCSTYTNSLLTTSLRPFNSQGPQLPAIAALLHIPQFRSIMYRTRSECRAISVLQTFLMKMMSRKRSDGYGTIQDHDVGDAVSSLQWFAQKVVEGCEATDADDVKGIIGSLRPEHGYAVNGNRLKTKSIRSVKEALETHPSQVQGATLLTLELERQEFDRKHRRWRKLTNRVEMDESLQLRDVTYSLYAYVTHTGGLMSNKHTLYIRPRGEGTPWYGYQDGKVVALTQKQAPGTHCGVDARKDSAKSSRSSSPFRNLPGSSKEEVAYVVFYLEDGKGHFDARDEEVWQHIPKAIKKTQTTDAKSRRKHAVEAGPPVITEQDRPDQTCLNASGSETPQWRMDGDDVVMSDAEDDETSRPADSLTVSTHLADTTSSKSQPTPCLTTIDALGQDYYHGQKLGDMRYGSGHLISMSGDEYTGDFHHDRPHGHGSMIYASSGSTYSGQWHNGTHHGHGTLTERNGNTYVGGWEFGRKHGQFTLTGTCTDEDKSTCTICYSRDMTTAFYDCGHVVACHECAARIETCPVCRKRVLARVQLFGVRVVLD